jgi:uncharacterized RDD family membrane protein YckC
MAFDINYILGNESAKDHWIKRGIAFIIDLIILMVIFFIVCMAIVAIVDSMGWDSVEGITLSGLNMVVGASMLTMALVALFTLVFTALYLIIMDTNMEGTFGKRLIGLRVEALEGNMTIQKGAFRNSTKLLGILIGAFFGIYLMGIILIVLMLVDLLMVTGQTNDPRQKFTDKLAGTIVVRTDIEENVEEMKYIPPVPAAPAPDGFASEGEGAGTPDGGDELTADQRQAVIEYTELFSISEARALNLYNAGYKSRDDFKDAIVEDLIIVEKINPTIAKSIIRSMESD